jgi:hypothetical protein
MHEDNEMYPCETCIEEEEQRQIERGARDFVKSWRKGWNAAIDELIQEFDSEWVKNIIRARRIKE